MTSELQAKFFWLSAKLQQIGWQNFSQRVLETKWRNRLFTNFLVFTYIRTSSETFFDFWKFLFANLSKLLSTSSDELFDQKNFRENLLSLFCRVVIKMFSDFSQKLYIRVVKNNFYVFSNYIEETEFSAKFTSCLVHTRTLNIISSVFSGQNFPQVFKTASYTFRRTLWWKTILLKNLLQSFALWSKQFFLTDDIFLLQNCQNCFLRLQVSTLIKKKLFEKLFLAFFRTVSNLFSDFRQNIYRQVVETVLYVFRNLFEDALFFNCFVFCANLDFEQIFFWHAAHFFL